LSIVQSADDNLGSGSMDDSIGIERTSIAPTADTVNASTLDQKQNASDAPPISSRSAGEKSKSFDEALATARRLHDREQVFYAVAEFFVSHSFADEGLILYR
jgi:hypothetical protein